MDASFTYRLAAFLAILLLAGCATQMPVSEGLVFTDEDGYGGHHPNRPDPIPFGIDGGEFMGGVSRFFPPASFINAARKEYGSPRADTLDKAYLFALPIPSFSFAYDNRFAVGTTIPIPGFWKIDATIRLFNQYYFTINKKIIAKNTEIILQRRLWFKNEGGVSVGMFYRYDPLRFGLLGEGKTFHISWFGVRTLFQTPEFANAGTHLRGFINAGYVPEFKAPLIVFGISVVLRSDDPPAPRRLSEPLF